MRARLKLAAQCADGVDGIDTTEDLMMTRTRLALAPLACAALLAACSSHHETTVRIPPLVDLQGYGVVAMIDFSSSADGTLATLATQRTVQALQAAQPGLRVLEIGGRDEVLREVGHEELNWTAVKAISEKYGVATVMSGHLEVTEVKPRIDLRNVLRSIHVEAEIGATLHARLLEGASGATLWSRSASATESVAHVSLTSSGPSFSADDPEEAYGRLVRFLVRGVTEDFRAHWQTH